MKFKKPASKKKLINSTLTVSFFTLISYLLFFLRDLFMVRWLGVGDEMDVFFLATMIPMFFVNIFSIPMGAAITPTYIALKSSNDRFASSKFVGSTLVFFLAFSAIVAWFLYIFSPQIFLALNWHFTEEKVAVISAVMTLYLLIMMIGGIIIIANAVLNAEGRIIYPAIAQLAVPVVVLIGLLLYGMSYGLYTVIYGMLVGQLVNVSVLAYAIKGQSFVYSLKPNWILFKQTFPFRQYATLIIAASSAALFSPTANFIAAQLPAGSIAAIGIGLKVIQLITGVIGIGMTSVLLPYFSGLIANQYHFEAKSDLTFFLMLATLISVPVTLCLRELAGPMIVTIFSNSSLLQDDIIQLIRIVQYGVAQLPFFICGIILIKFITAYQRNGIILFISILNVLIAFYLGVYLVVIMGVSGISLAITVSLITSSIILLFYARNFDHLKFLDGLVIFINWLAFFALYTCLHFHLISALITTSILFVLLQLFSWHMFISKHKLVSNA